MSKSFGEALMEAPAINNPDGLEVNSNIATECGATPKGQVRHRL